MTLRMLFVCLLFVCYVGNEDIICYILYLYICIFDFLYRNIICFTILEKESDIVVGAVEGRRNARPTDNTCK